MKKGMVFIFLEREQGVYQAVWFPSVVEAKRVLCAYDEELWDEFQQLDNLEEAFYDEEKHLVIVPEEQGSKLIFEPLEPWDGADCVNDCILKYREA